MVFSNLIKKSLVIAGFCLVFCEYTVTAQEVIINGRGLTEAQIAEFEQIYGAKPMAGNYWYDSVSGLYGVTGFPAFGFMFAGHDYGTLDRNASNGNIGVFINGRQIELTEYTVWSQILGIWIQPGSYWLDENGNAGYEGIPIPMWNLYIAAQYNAYSGSGGGDNFWGSRFGAGNYDSGGQRGYVSVPGHGPIGYGF
jgi:roadblock/LC7 domain-containing protein